MSTVSGGAGEFETLQRAVSLHQAGRLDEAAALYRSVLAVNPDHADALYFLGMVAAQRSQFIEAERLIGRMLALNTRNADAYSNYGGILRALNRPQEALAALDRAIALNPQMHAAHANRGIILHTLKRYEEAVASYDQALALVPNDPTTMTYRGGALLSLDRHHDALASFDRALAINPGFQPAMTYRGNALGMLKRNEEALASYDRALSLNPNDVMALANRGNVLSGLNRPAEAIASYDRALAIKPDETTALANRGIPLLALGRYDEAIAGYDRAIAVQPGNAEAHYNRGTALQAVGRCLEAQESYRTALKLKPDYAAAAFGLCMAQLPAIYMDEAEIIRAREAYAAQLTELEGTLARLDVVDLARAVGSNQPFHLAYQGLNDRDLQRRYGTFVCEVMARRFPAAPMPASPAPGERIRVGIPTGFFRSHSIWKIPAKGWVSQLDRSRFEVFGYHTGSLQDEDTLDARHLCDHFEQGPMLLEQWRETILADRLHAILYPDIGMDPMAIALAAQRLAPVQCNTLGHPITSGCPTIDYFLTADLMEPPDTEDQYTETLVRLPNISVYYEPTQPPSQLPTRADVGLRADAVVYWSGQSLYKYLPQYDEVFPRIAKEVPNCQIVFIEYYRGSHVTGLFRRRLERAFAAFGLRTDDVCVFLPRFNPQQFVAAASTADIFLDSIQWSGFNSTLECMTHNLPIVTLARPLMRGRHTTGVLRMMGVTETIFETIDDYVAAAVRLGRDADWRAALGAKIAANKHKLYHDRTAIAALEDFLERAVRRGTAWDRSRVTVTSPDPTPARSPPR
ncbi:MAG: tetratricopeptide repeat protein [Xanthobacteraceae bacterium]|nr:tetratricopeptide repeat protein [Xanthobacteraceae bacterium]